MSISDLQKRTSMSSLRRLCIGAAALAIFVGTFLAASTILIHYKTDGLTYDDISLIPRHRVGIILGCPRKLSGGRLNPFFSSRISAAATLFRAGKVDYLLASGDNYSRGCFETAAMREALIREGIPSEKIYCDYKGLRTLDSVVRAKELFGQKQLLIISQDFHNRRAIFIARQRGLDAVGFNADDVNAYDSLLTKGRELFASALAILDVYIFNTAPRFSGTPVQIGGHDSPAGNCTNP